MYKSKIKNIIRFNVNVSFPPTTVVVLSVTSAAASLWYRSLIRVFFLLCSTTSQRLTFTTLCSLVSTLEINLVMMGGGGE